MKTLFSGNADLFAVAIISLVTGIGSSINFEHRVTERVADRIVNRIGDRMVTRTHMRMINHQIVETKREIDAALKTISCERMKTR